MKTKRVDCLTSSIGESFSSETVSMNIYPNPAMDVIHLSFESGSGANTFNSVKIFNTTLQLMTEQSVGSSASIDISYLPLGTYLLSAENTTGKKFFRLFSKQ
jgi:hypothetical protein